MAGTRDEQSAPKGVESRVSVI